MEITLGKLHETIIYLDKFDKDVRIPFIKFSFFVPDDKVFYGEMVDTVLNEKYLDFNIERHQGFLVSGKFEALLRSKVGYSGCPMKSP